MSPTETERLATLEANEHSTRDILIRVEQSLNRFTEVCTTVARHDEKIKWLSKSNTAIWGAVTLVTIALVTAFITHMMH
jgi:hypothetical protein